METPIRNHQQQKVTGGEQKVILDAHETAETDELDPKFDEDRAIPETDHSQKVEPGDDPRTELI